jgi:hypothetical protein
MRLFDIEPNIWRTLEFVGSVMRYIFLAATFTGVAALVFLFLVVLEQIIR